MSKRQWIRLEIARVLLWLKTWWHPEHLGDGDRRRKPRRTADRKKDRAIRFWLGLLTAFYFLTFAQVQCSIEDRDVDRVEGTRQRCALIRDIITAAIELGADPSAPGIIRLEGRHQECLMQLEEIKKETDVE